MIKQTIIRKPQKPKKRVSKAYFALIILSFLALVFSGSNYYLAGIGENPLSFYANLANPYMRYVYIPAGLRREEIAEIFRKTLSWSPTQVREFLASAPSDERGILDGYYMPGRYWVEQRATGKEVASQMLNNFNSAVAQKIVAKGITEQASTITAGSTNTSQTKAQGDIKNTSSRTNPFNSTINLDTAVRIASIIEKEAAGKKDMNLISGVIWNRMFKGMNLQMDATLQYAKASSTDWWPTVTGKDKYIESPFNTYLNKGLPPTAISNPSVEAIIAAINPAKTDCLYYIHDNNRNIHCERTYDAHKANVEKYLIGRK